jgi:S-adenosylmethionine:tRNA ribosyltransferase-isomerase
MLTRDLDYDLPQELIAQTPIEPRDAARLLIVGRDTGELTHRVFRDVGEYLRPGDLLIANESRVIPARLRARKAGTGGAVEVLLLRKLDDLTWEVLIGGKRIRTGTQLEILDASHHSALTAGIVEAREGPRRVVHFEQPIEPLFGVVGVTPLPPYIHAPLADPERYQTIYSHTPGSAAAPTAGLHFTPDLMLALRRQGVEFGLVTLHIGLDTFKPVDEERVEDHHIHTEWCSLSPEVARQINEAKLAGRRIIAVGTTSVRVLETAARKSLISDLQSSTSDLRPPTCPWRTVSAFEGFSDLFIYPGFQFRVVDAMLTNFHLPRSTLLALVSAFAGRDLILRAYQVAISERYRFYSFGDAMFIV